MTAWIAGCMAMVGAGGSRHGGWEEGGGLNGGRGGRGVEGRFRY